MSDAKLDRTKPAYAPAPYFAMLAARYTATFLLIGYMFAGLSWVAIAAFIAWLVAAALYIMLKDKSEWGEERATAVLLHIAFVVIAGAVAAYAIWAPH